ncbi:hypothetical protein [Listeria fleischmannii]|nr:hypothetical protein [Listeria fleischmannii]
MKKIGLMISVMILLLTIAACGNDQKTMEQEKKRHLGKLHRLK